MREIMISEVAMKAAFVEKAASDAKVEMREVSKPHAGPGQVLIECHYGSLNWADTMISRGVYPGQQAAEPYVALENIIPGAEASGHIAALGEGVEGFEIGQVVTAISPALTGAFAEFMVTWPDLVTPLSIDAPTAEAAAFRGVGFTAYHLLFTAYQLKPDDIVLVHSISGGVGQAVSQLAIEIGATVLGTTGSAAKAAQAEASGAKKVFIRGEEDFVAGVRDVTDGYGVDLVIDPLGGDILMQSMDALAVLGHIINIGNTGDAGWPGSAKEFHDRLYRNCGSYQGFDVFRSAPPGSEQWKAGIDYLVERFDDGRFSLPVARVFPLDKCEEMFAAIRSASFSGKLCLKIR